jgi:MFS family permease
MVRLELFRVRNFAVANVMFVVLAFGMLGIFFPLTIYLQGGLGYSPFEAGLIGAPLSVAMMATAPVAGRLSDRIDPRRLILIGMALIASGIVVLALQVDTDTTWPSLMLPMVMLGTGMGMTMSPTTAVAMMEVPRGIAGSASGIINTTRSIGQVLGIAVLGTILQTRMGSETETRLARVEMEPGLRDRLVEMAEASQFEAIARSLADLPELLPVAMAVIDDAFADAVRFTFLTSAGICVVGFLVAMLIRQPRGAEATRQATDRPGARRPARVATSPGE